MRKLKTPEGNGATMGAFIRSLRMTPAISSIGEAYVCRVCGTELLRRKRKYRYYGNLTTSMANWCPICVKFRDANTSILQSRYYEGMPGREV